MFVLLACLTSLFCPRPDARLAVCACCPACCHVQYKLRLAAMGWFLGALTYRQLSRLAVMSYPYAMRVLFLATEIMQQRKKLLSCQQQPSS